MSFPKPRILHFNIRGRVEPLRLMFEELAEAYEDARVNSREAWQLMRPQTPFGALPLYEKGDLNFAQSQAMYRHVARTRDLYGDNESDRVQCDVGAAAISDAIESLWKLFWEPDYQSKLAAYVAGPFGEIMLNLERWFTRDTQQPEFWVSDRLSFVDFFAYRLLEEVDALLPAAFGFCIDGVKFDPRQTRAPRAE
jgi:hypothetical protein